MKRFLGRWDVAVKSPVGSENGEWVFSEEDGRLNGTMRIMGEDVSLEDIAVEGDSFSCEATVKAPIGELEVTVSGTIDGNHISGTADGGMMALEFEGDKR